VVSRALASGRIVRPSICEDCGGTGKAIEAAHHDYAKPLEVRWLCRSCHSRWDRAQPKTKIDPVSLPSYHRLGNAKITRVDAEAIRAAYQPGVTTQREIGERYGITQSHVSQILRDWFWKEGC
jgi:hypothetical protein